MRVRLLIIIASFLAVLLPSCAAWQWPGERPEYHGAAVPPVWVSRGLESYGNVDSLAVARDATGRPRVFATAKSHHVIHVFDAATGRHVRTFGLGGKAPGELHRPNGIAAVRLPAAPLDLLAVVERDNARVQFFTPAGKPVGIVGAGKLNRPYGAAVSRGRGEVQLYVTDTEVPPAETVKVFRLAWRDGRAEGRWLRSFGASDGPGRLHSVESIVVDDAHDRVYVADEDRWNRGIQIYTRDGRFTGRALGTDLFDADPEGLALIDAPGGGWLIATEQGEVRTVWHAFGRGDYARVGSFSGSGGIANTDGVAVWPHPLEGFGGGAFFAVHDDAGIRAYRLEEIRAAVANPANPRSIEAVAGASPVR